MANNTEVTEGSGKIIATDEVAGVNYQRIKLVDGTEDSTTAIVAGGGVEAGALRVTIASDSTGVLSVDDNGGSLTVDGTVAVTNADIASSKTALELIDNAVDGNYLNVNMNIAGTDVGAGAASVPISDGGNVITVDGTVGVTGVATETTLGTVHGHVDSIDGKITVCDTGAVVLATGSAAIGKLAAGSNVIGEVLPSKSPITDDSAFVKKFYTYTGAVTDGIVWSPAAGKRWYVTDIIINVSAAATIILEDDLTAGDSPVMQFEMAANGGMVSNFKTPLASGEDGADLLITTTAGNVYVTVTGYEV